MQELADANAALKNGKQEVKVARKGGAMRKKL